jgi:hypothetical protein
VVCLKCEPFLGEERHPPLLPALHASHFQPYDEPPRASSSVLKRSPNGQGMATNRRSEPIPRQSSSMGPAVGSFLQKLQMKINARDPPRLSFANSTIPWVGLGRVGLGRVGLGRTADSTSSTTRYIEDAGQLLFVQWVPLPRLVLTTYLPGWVQLLRKANGCRMEGPLANTVNSEGPFS